MSLVGSNLFCGRPFRADLPPPPSSCIHLSLNHSPLRVDIINGWPINPVINFALWLWDTWIRKTLASLICSLGVNKSLVHTSVSWQLVNGSHGSKHSAMGAKLICFSRLHVFLCWRGEVYSQTGWGPWPDSPWGLYLTVIPSNLLFPLFA